MNILAIGAHPDDIEFGCGGTLLKYARRGHNINLLILTYGGIGADPEVRAREQEDVVNFIGAGGLFWGRFKDTELVDGRELILAIEKVINQVKPDIVFLNYLDDIHQDHRAAANAGISATRYIKEVLFYEVPTTRNFEPDVFVDVGDILPDKMKLLQLHASQVDKTRVEGLSIVESATSCVTFRGYQGRVKYAEGFKALRILRDIEKE